jgi:Kef-type K+ transport system membrane component KefB
MILPLSTLLLVPGAAVAAVLAATLIGRWVAIPLVVFEIVLGLLIGPSVLGWVDPGQFITITSNFGLVLLFFFAGSEIDFAAIRGRPLSRAALGWVISIVVGVLLGLVFAPSASAGVYVGVALASTALGTIMPMLRDAGELATPFGRAVIAVGAVGSSGRCWRSPCSSVGASPGRRRWSCWGSPSLPAWRSGWRRGGPPCGCTG